MDTKGEGQRNGWGGAEVNRYRICPQGGYLPLLQRNLSQTRVNACNAEVSFMKVGYIQILRIQKSHKFL